MSKVITFPYEGKDYTLEFTCDSVRTLERDGFVIEDMAKKPMTVLPKLFAGAFLANHKHDKNIRSKIDEIYKKFTNKGELIEKLAEMYNETVETLVDEPEDGDEGNISWKSNW